ncbi:ribonuclease III [Blastochloris tepida]|jgi:ribonuclease-3|uniref:Ribonuclease 3 n=1 Tax=Blastochloris tepida TaxID=2233851 RepID=A0A348FYQ8_9HYPH|nr:ribonuclease III [Blastochloris tepida]BBF92441.1 ribonuclease 3 [Blastochloris tepida]
MSRKRDPLEQFEASIGYAFADRSLLELALTHVSAASGARARLESYQRLEFLGDHVLGLAVSAMLYRAFPDADEGELSQRLADLVRKESCAEVAQEWQVGPHMRLGPGEVQTGGRRKAAILANICESVIGAVFLDGGYAAAETFIERHWSKRMLSPVVPVRDPKSALQEWAQARGLPPPAYRVVERVGPDHSPRFTIAVELPGLPAVEGGGSSKRLAEQSAAEEFLVRQGVISRMPTDA